MIREKERQAASGLGMLFILLTLMLFTGYAFVQGVRWESPAVVVAAILVEVKAVSLKRKSLIGLDEFELIARGVIGGVATPTT
jgi:hypothetical protein